jgi:ubiquitin-protein ligase
MKKLLNICMYWLQRGPLSSYLAAHCCAVPCSRCAVQELLDTPNEKSPAQSDAFQSFTANLAEYRRKVRKQALQFPPPS